MKRYIGINTQEYEILPEDTGGLITVDLMLM
jgi:hypothetical protein